MRPVTLLQCSSSRRRLSTKEYCLATTGGGRRCGVHGNLAVRRYAGACATKQRLISTCPCRVAPCSWNTNTLGVLLCSSTWCPYDPEPTPTILSPRIMEFKPDPVAPDRHGQQLKTKSCAKPRENPFPSSSSSSLHPAPPGARGHWSRLSGIAI